MCPLPATILALCLLVQSNPLLKEYRRETGTFGQLYSRGGRLSHPEDRVANIEKNLRLLEEKLGRRLEQPITVVLVPTRKELTRLLTSITGKEPSSWLLGVALPDRRWIIVREDDPWEGYRHWEQPEVTLLHELTHLLIHRREDVFVPRWLDEGIAMWASQRGLPSDDEARISGLARIDGLFTLKYLRHRFPKRHHPGTIAYQQSMLMIMFLAERHGDTMIVRLLDALEAGEPLLVAYERLTGDSWERFDDDFRAWIVSRHSLLEVVASLVSFWTIITLLAIVAMLLGALRRRKMKRRLEEIEAREAKVFQRHEEKRGGDHEELPGNI